MFKRGKTAEALLFEFKKPTKWAITSYFVFFPFLAIWLDNKNKVMEMRKVKPFKFHIAPKKPFSKLVEIPINSKYEKIVRLLKF